ncbi:uncharacterized protein [Littorina saxatilis]|uniref:SOCS box domain-containing protein n=1 Tax=Littorina saxatilis TaxID=31220 RepID=A0AAN9BL02_9CAEN
MDQQLQSNRHKQVVNAARERIAFFKAAWGSRRREKNKTDVSKLFTCSGEHVLCNPIEPVLCKCERRPDVQPETVDLYSYPTSLDLVIHPSLDRNQLYLDLLHHSPFHRTITETSVPLTVTFADVAASAGNLDFLRHLFTSSDECVRQFYSEYYSYRDSAVLLKLFVHALNGGSTEVVVFLVETFLEELTSDVKVVILELCLWLATTEKSLVACFQLLALKFGVNIANNNESFCPLRLTCMYDNGDAAGFLIDHGADMYAENAHGTTIAYHAYKYGRYLFGLHRVLRTMLDKGFHVEATMVQGSHFRYPLMYTFLNHSEVDLVQYLVSCGHGVNMPIRIRVDDQERCITPLMHALVCKCFHGTRWLIHQGADVNQRSFLSQRLEDESWTPLHIAVTLGNLSIVRLLVKHGAQPGSVTATGETVMSLALEKAGTLPESLNIASYLIQINTPVRSIPGLSFLVKPKLEEAVRNSWTMLDLAVYNADVLGMNMLLKGGYYAGQAPKVSQFLAGVLRPISNPQRRVMKVVEDFAAQRGVPLLQGFCRECLRRACGLRLVEYVNTTVMPARLRSYLLMEDLFGPLDRQVDREEDGDGAVVS